LSPNSASKVGFFSSDPWSKRAQSLEESFRQLGVHTIQVIPWKVSRRGSTNRHEISMNGEDLSLLDLMIVLDLGATDIGAFFNRVGLLSALTEMEILTSTYRRKDLNYTWMNGSMTVL